MTQAPTGTPAPRAPWYAFATPTIGKGVRWASRITHHGGSAFPGKVVERVDPGFLRRTLAQLPLGVVLVSGTNGKTTTTRMVSMMLESLGLRVFTNPTGSNFTRGVVSALLQEVSADGALDADIAVLKLGLLMNPDDLTVVIVGLHAVSRDSDAEIGGDGNFCSHLNGCIVRQIKQTTLAGCLCQIVHRQGADASAVRSGDFGVVVFAAVAQHIGVLKDALPSLLV